MRRVNGLATAGTDLHFSILHSPGLLFIDHKNCSFTIKKLNMANYSLYCHIAKNLLYRKIFQTFWDAYIYIYIHIYICVCVCVCVYVRMYVRVYVCMYVCLHACMYEFLTMSPVWTNRYRVSCAAQYYTLEQHEPN